jgi:iron complex transport system substrate-binding protein
MNRSALDRRRFLQLSLGATALTLAGCNASAGGSGEPAASTGASPATGFTWTDARGATIDLPSPPTIVVAQSSAAAALWDFGLEVAGGYGELAEDGAGKLSYQAGSLDLSQVTVLGSTYGEFDIEKYAAMNPELLVDLSFDDKTLWYVPSKVADQVEKIAPTLGMRMLDLDLLEIIEEFARLSGTLGADLNAALVTGAKRDFETGVAAVKAASAANPGLRALGVSRTADKVWIANAKQHPDFAYLQTLGVEFVPAGGKDTDYFTEISYEELDKYSGDVIFDDARSPETQQASDQVALWKSLPAVKSGQVYDWKAAAPYSYLSSAPIFADFAKALSTSKVVTESS